MSHFAKINSKNIVEQVIVIEQEVLNTGHWGDPTSWVQTSYNTYGGVHNLGGTPLRKNFAGVGYTYDASRDAFIPPKPFASWLLNENTCLWEAPISRPAAKGNIIYVWNEDTVSWIEIDPEAI
jgi:hypothetical protein